jgi:hypothetical protein
MKHLSDIQAKLHVPKGNTNAFGKYKYRTCGDILEALKPLLNGCTITLSDEMVMVGDRYYVKATAVLLAPDGQSTTVTAFARESFDKKGMDDSQITGAASTYARKYALNGLLAIDDTDDADAMDNTKHKTTPITPSTGVWESLSDDMQIYLKELAGEVKGFIDAGNIQGAVETKVLAKLDADTSVAFWTLFDPKDRAAMKKEHERLAKIPSAVKVANG